MLSTDFAIMGAGGFGVELRDWVSTYFPERYFWGFVDDNPRSVLGRQVTLTKQFLDAGTRVADVYCGIGSPQSRMNVFRAFKASGRSFSSLVSPKSNVAQSSSVGIGAIVLGNSSIAAGTVVGTGFLLQGFAVVGHDVRVADFVSIYSFAFVGGGVKVGEGVSVFPHACILPGVTIGKNSTIGAGSIVVSDVPEGVTVFGNPAKVIKA